MSNPEKPEDRRSNLADPDLVRDARKQLKALHRDLTDPATDGITTARLEAHETQIETLDVMPSDVVSEQRQAEETAEKDKAVGELRDALRAVAGPVGDAYGTTSPRYKRLNVLDLTRKDDDELLRAATDCHATGTTFLTDAACVQEGLTQAHLAAIPPRRQALVDLLTSRDNLVMERSIAAQARVRQHNVVYDEYAVFNEKGQRRFQHDPARYDDYVGRADSGASAADGGGATPPPAP